MVTIIAVEIKYLNTHNITLYIFKITRQPSFFKKLAYNYYIGQLATSHDELNSKCQKNFYHFFLEYRYFKNSKNH